MKKIQISPQLVDQLEASLPAGLSFKKIQPNVIGSSDSSDVKAVLQLDNKEIPIDIGVQTTVSGTALLRETAREVKNYALAQGTVPFVAGIFFGERSREVAKEEGVGLIDLAGNFYLKKDDIYIERIIEKNPNTQKSPLKNLFAPISSRITRALLTEPKRTWVLTELVDVTKVSLGQTYKIVERMKQEELLERNKEGRIVLKNPSVLLDEWKKVYPTYQQEKYSFYTYQQGYMAVLDSVLSTGKRNDLPFALGFFSGAGLVAPFIRGINKVQLHIKNSEDLQIWKDQLELEEVASGGNIEIYLPYDQGVFYNTQTIYSAAVGDVPVVSNVQLYMDLCNNPARGAEQAEHLRETKLLF